MVWCRNIKIYNLNASLNSFSLVVVWCRNIKIYNTRTNREDTTQVVVWCRNIKIYNEWSSVAGGGVLWFGVGI